jgi:four helix bundle protein
MNSRRDDQSADAASRLGLAGEAYEWRVEESPAAYDRAANSPSPLKDRTRAFAVRVIRLVDSMPKAGSARMIGRQLLRSGTSVGAHYREGIRARSSAELISKLEVGLQELEESLYWMELLAEANLVPEAKLSDLTDEADQLIAILVTSIRKVKARNEPPSKK